MRLANEPQAPFDWNLLDDGKRVRIQLLDGGPRLELSTEQMDVIIQWFGLIRGAMHPARVKVVVASI